MLIALSAMFGMLHAHRESFHDSKMELRAHFAGTSGMELQRIAMW